MGKSTRQGIYAREASILIYFRWEGRTHRERLDLSPTPANLKYAERLRSEILRRIELGTFSLLEFFPGSRSESRGAGTFKEFADAWHTSKSKVIAATTAKEYRNLIDGHFSQLFDRPIAGITFLDIDRLMAGLDVSGKTHNNVLSALRGIFDYAVKAGAMRESPAAKIEFAKKSEPQPDPLSLPEIEAVLADMEKHYPEQVANYFEAAFFIGFRPSEGIALRWQLLDWNDETLTIDSAKVRGIDKDTKTHRSRTVELDARCMAMFKRQKKHTFMAGEIIFRNPVTGEPYYDTSALVEKYWRPSLKRLGIRDRDARQTRHTCATLMLMAGCNPAWAARQLGHSVQMFWKTYSKWIDRADSGRERAKLAEFSQSFHNERIAPAKSIG